MRFPPASSRTIRRQPFACGCCGNWPIRMQQRNRPSLKRATAVTSPRRGRVKAPACLTPSFHARACRRSRGWRLHFGAVVVFRDKLIGQFLARRGRLEVIAQGRAGAAGIDIGCAAMRLDIIEMDGAKIDAVTRDAARVRDRLMELRTGEEDAAARRRQIADARPLDFLLWLWLLPCVGLDMLRRGRAALLVPSVVVVDFAVVPHRLVEIVRIKAHAVVAVELIDRQPPVQLHGARSTRCRGADGMHRRYRTRGSR